MCSSDLNSVSGNLPILEAGEHAGATPPFRAYTIDGVPSNGEGRIEGKGQKVSDEIFVTMQWIKPDGSVDTAREPLFIGEAQIMTNAGPLPINFEIEAANLADAVARFGEAAKEGIERTVRELQELRRQQASSIVVPGAGGMGGMGGLGGMGGMGGGGKIGRAHV